jgi:hypothetical protein
VTSRARWAAPLALALVACGDRDVVQMRPGVNPPIIVGARVLEPEVVRAYLRDSVAPRRGAASVCAYSLLGADGPRAFVWALCTSRSDTGGVPTSAVSLPVALRVDVSGAEARIVGHQRPRDGGGFRADLDSIFPAGVAGVALQTGPLAEARLASLDSAVRAEARAARQSAR